LTQISTKAEYTDATSTSYLKKSS